MRESVKGGKHKVLCAKKCPEYILSASQEHITLFHVDQKNEKAYILSHKELNVQVLDLGANEEDLAASREKRKTVLGSTQKSERDIVKVVCNMTKPECAGRFRRWIAYMCEKT